MSNIYLTKLAEMSEYKGVAEKLKTEFLTDVEKKEKQEHSQGSIPGTAFKGKETAKEESAEVAETAAKAGKKVGDEVGGDLAKAAALSIGETGATGGDAQRIVMNANKRMKAGKAELAVTVPDRRSKVGNSTVSNINSLPPQQRASAAAQAQRRAGIDSSKLPAIRDNTRGVLVGGVKDVTPTPIGKMKTGGATITQGGLPSVTRQATHNAGSAAKPTGLLSKLKGRTGLAVAGGATLLAGAGYAMSKSNNDGMAKAAGFGTEQGNSPSMASTAATGATLVGAGAYGKSVYDRAKKAGNVGMGQGIKQTVATDVSTGISKVRRLGGLLRSKFPLKV